MFMPRFGKNARSPLSRTRSDLFSWKALGWAFSGGRSRRVRSMASAISARRISPAPGRSRRRLLDHLQPTQRRSIERAVVPFQHQRFAVWYHGSARFLLLGFDNNDRISPRAEAG
jgi:hypothetical protein